MFSLARSTTLRTASIAAVARSATLTPASASAALVARRWYTNVRDAPGAFGKKEAAQEEKFIHDHDKELIMKLKKELNAREEALKAKEDVAAHKATAPSSSSSKSTDETEQIHVSQAGYGGTVNSGSTSFGKKEAAIEGKYFMEQDKEKVKELKKQQKK
ncbi:hypothetical protein HDV05_008619 [Chytridiales sp. JEL 0842]|nr:hypothetical protein HDV05_008619 [Chytridiales sp. JEL 0842]